MNNSTPTSAADRDYQEYLAARDSTHAELLAYAAKKTGRSALSIQREFSQLAKSDGRLNLVEYVRNGLYDINRFSEQERAEFISNDLHWPITNTCNDKSWSSAAEDKAVASLLLSTGGVPVPETLAVIDWSPRLYPGLAKITSAEDLRELVLSHPGEEIFGKVTGGMVSFGAFRITSGDQDTITCFGLEPMSYERFLSDFIGGNSYLLQRNLKNHSKFARYCSALATVRMVNMVTDEGVKCPLAIIKMPQGDNIADAFWRPGNLACEIDMDTGKIRTIALRGIETQFLEDHPEEPGLMGLEMPFWPELKEINERAARVFAPIRYQSTDIAITEEGPVVVEINYGGGFDLPQYASGRGMLTPEVRAFFESCGYKFGARKKRRFRLFGR